MKRLSTIGVLCLMFLIGLCLSCGGSDDTASPEGGETPSAADVEAAADSAVDTVKDAADEAVADADATVDEINAKLAEKRDDLQKVTDELMGLSPEEMIGDKGKELKAKSEALNDEIQMLEEKLKSLME